MCEVLEVSKSGYYNWLHTSASERIIDNKKTTSRIIAIYNESNGTYGSPMITKALEKESLKVSRPRVARLMKDCKLQSIRKRKFVTTTDSRHEYAIVENLLDRNFNVETLGKVWVSDITYIPTDEGWLYLTTVIDLADRKVIGWALSETMKAVDTTIAALKMAFINRAVAAGEELMFHSDRGIQYACTEFRDALEGHRNVIRSMSRKGNCWDNAVAESFFKTLKCDLIYQNRFTIILDAKAAIFEYIEIWYNKKRMHSSLGYRTPEEMEKYLLNKKLVA